MHRVGRLGRRARVRVHELRARRGAQGVRELRAARPEGRVHVPRHRARALDRAVEPAGAGARARGASGVVGVAFPGHAAHLDLPDRRRGRRLPPGHRRAHHPGRPGDPARAGLPGLAGRATSSADDMFAITKQGFDFYTRLFGTGYPFAKYDQVVRAGVRRRRDGERRLRDDLRAVPVPVEGHRPMYETARHGDPARDGAHVVRRPGDHEVVGRPVAERVVRRVLRLPLHRRGDPVHRRLDDVRQPPQGGRLHAGQDAVHAPGRRERADADRGDRELRRDQLRQGRFGAQAAGRLRRPGELLRRHPALPRRPRLGQRDPRRPAARAGRELGQVPGRLVARVAGDRRPEHAAQPSSRSAPDGAFTSFAVLQEAPAEHPTLRPHHIAIGLYNRAGGALARTRRVEVDVDRRAHAPCRTWSARRSPTSSCSTTTTSATRWSGSTRGRWPR